MKRGIIVLVSALLLSHASGQQPDADRILNRSRELSMISSMQATISLSILEKNGATRNRTIAMTSKSYPGGLEKRFIKFLEPADVRGTSMLIIDNKDVQDEIWIYLPALKKTRRISSSENARSFMSSEFSNADMGSPTLADFKSRHIEGSGANDTWIIESVPVDEEKADEYGYSRKISYISMDKYRVSRMEFCNFDNKHFKTIEITEFHDMPEGKYMVSRMAAMNQINGRKSEIIFRNISDNVKVEDSFFSVQNLER